MADSQPTTHPPNQPTNQPTTQPTQPPTHHAQILAWQQEMEANLRAEDSWLAVAGLFWLQDGRNSFGSDPTNDIVLPEVAPARAGSFIFEAGQTRLEVADGMEITVDGEAVTEAHLRPDMPGPPSLVGVNGLLLHVIGRGTRYAIRLRDKNSPTRRNFTGRRWFPIQADYRVEAQFTPYEPAKELLIPDVLGQTTAMASPGYVTFSLHGQQVRLDIVEERGGQPYFIFKDRTSGQTTYPPGRFLLAAWLDERRIMIDFNQAYNPPCAFTAYATCPLPPPQNHLPIAIEAGERYGKGEG